VFIHIFYARQIPLEIKGNSAQPLLSQFFQVQFAKQILKQQLFQVIFLEIERVQNDRKIVRNRLCAIAGGFVKNH